MWIIRVAVIWLVLAVAVAVGWSVVSLLRDPDIHAAVYYSPAGYRYRRLIGKRTRYRPARCACGGWADPNLDGHCPDCLAESAAWRGY